MPISAVAVRHGMLMNWIFAVVYVVCSALTFTTGEAQYRLLIGALTPAGLFLVLGAIAVVAYYASGRSLLAVRLGWGHLNLRWLVSAMALGALLGAVVLSLLQMRGGRIALVTPQTAIPSVTVGPIAEELLFRAVLFAVVAWVLEPVPGWVARLGTVLGTALLFACAHEVHSPLRFLTLLISGCALGWLRMISQSVTASAVAHTVYNAVVVGFNAP